MKKLMLMFLLILFSILLGWAISYCCDGIPILSYHSWSVGDGSSCGYSENSHVALEQDLEILNAQGFKIIPLKWVVEWRLGFLARESLPQYSVAITFDDGADLDWIDFNHPVCSFTKSFKRILEEFQLKYPEEQDYLQATSFVIASPLYRRLLSKELLNDNWWKKAVDSGLFAIQNHSNSHGQSKGREDFLYVDNFVAAAEEIALSAEYIKYKTGIYPQLFAYPWGQANNYLKKEYFPEKNGNKTLAAFGTQPECVGSGSDIFELPRFVFIRDWSSPEQFRTLLESWKGKD